MPTATGYALAANPFDAAAVAEVFRLKGRADGKPLLLLCRDFEQAKSLMEPPDACRLSALAYRFWPGSLTVIAPCVEPRLAPGIAGADGRVAVRVDPDRALAGLLAALGVPLTGTSANRSGGSAALSVRQVYEQFPGGLGYVLDGGPAASRKPSTIVDLTGRPRVIREGALPAEMVLSLC